MASYTIKEFMNMGSESLTDEELEFYDNCKQLLIISVKFSIAALIIHWLPWALYAFGLPLGGL